MVVEQLRRLDPGAAARYEPAKRYSPVGLSSESVTKHKKLLLDAVELFQVSSEKSPQAILEDPALNILPSILPDLKQQIESSKEIEGVAFRLLQSAVTEYWKHLENLKHSEGLVNKDKVTAQLHELTEQGFREDLGSRRHLSA